jgi:hypothetical protein
MIDAMLAARSREDFVSATRALDRVLLSGFYVVPLFNQPEQWIARSRRGQTAGADVPFRVPARDALAHRTMNRARCEIPSTWNRS